MVIGEQLNQQQQAQQQIAPHRLNASQQSNRRNSANTLPSPTNSNSGPNLNNTSKNNNNNSNVLITNDEDNAGGLVGGVTSTAAAKNHLEQLNTMREALFSQDGWGCQHVNQDTNWEVPSSPEPATKDSSTGPTLWKPTINNGTELWESNLRNGGQPSSQQVQKTPWGHTPSSNLGGTWGEDDDGADSGSVWVGSTANVAPSGNGVVGAVGSGVPNNTPQWGQNMVGVNNVGNIVGVAAGGTQNTSTVNSIGGSVGSASNNNTINNWGDSRELRSGQIGGTLDMRNVDPRDSLRAASAGDPRELRMLDPRDPIRGDPRGISGRLNGTSEMWGQHHPIVHQMPAVGKIVGGSVANSAAVSAAVVTGIGAAVGSINVAGGSANNVNSQWGAPQAVNQKEISMSGKPATGWEEPSPPPQRRNIPNYDDGTSLWGQQSRVPGGGSHWKEISEPMNRSHLLRTNIGNQNASSSNIVSGLGGGGTGALLNSGTAGGMNGPTGISINPNNSMAVGGPQVRLNTSVGSGIGGQHKQENPMWVHAGSSISGRSTSWVDDGNSHNVNIAGGNWVDDKANATIAQIGAPPSVGNSWNDSSAAWNKNQNKSGNNSGWGNAGTNDNELGSDWSSHGGIVGKSQPKLSLNNDMIKQSKQYRILVDAGFKKDDVERALMNANLNIDEAAEILRTNTSMVMDNWRRHDETLGSYSDHSNPSSGGYTGRYPVAGTQPTMSFPPNNHLLNNMSANAVNVGNNPNLTGLNSMQSLQVQKYLNQAPHSVSSLPQPINATAVAFGQGSNVASAINATNSNNQPSAQQLRMLVQQIQLAVHNGYLSSQILNQPLAPATLLLLNQLLSNIKHLQGAQQSLARGNNSNNLQISVAIAKYKQTIQSLQNQINAQQAIYIKQQSLQQNPHNSQGHVSNANSDYLRGQHDTISALQGNFSDININKPSGYQGAPNQQSRLNQWKLPVLEKDLTVDNTDFSRAPGTTKQNLTTTNPNNIGPLSLQNDCTWSSGRHIGDGWPDTSSDSENKDWSVAQTSSATTYTDLVQEFEPGKPWKGSQMKSIEDDPSITPGSVARSPLSINPTPKDSDIFASANKNSPADLPPLSLSSSTWSFNPSNNNQGFPSWSDNTQQCSTSELWAAPLNKTSRGPPPGLGANKGVSVSAVPSAVNSASVASCNSNGWLVGNGNRGVPNANVTWSGTNSNWNSNWLLLKNLTNQIDGSTLRTLCMQHGPLLTCHLYLNQGIALCKYATREEANKAQVTLNNCVLGNTTICAESPSENDVQNILQHLPQSSNITSTTNISSSGSNTNTNASSGIATSGASGGNGSGSSSNSGVMGNSTVGGSSVIISSNGNNAPNSNSSVNGQNQSASACNLNGSINSSCGSTGVVGNTNASSGSNNSTWRQTQNIQNQSRPSGRESDFDYISKFVCSIVDD